jgi:hypothetical protein
MPPQSGDKTAVLARRADVAYLYCRGWPQHKIAAKYHVTRQQIGKDLAGIRAEWQRVMVREFDTYKAEQLAKLDAMEAEAWRGWRRSLRDAVKQTTKMGPAPPPEQKATRSADPDAADDPLAEAAEPPADMVVTEDQTVTEGQTGDPRFLQIIGDCIDKRLRVVGGYAKDASPQFGPVVVQVFGRGFDPAQIHGGGPEGDVIDADNSLPARR